MGTSFRNVKNEDVFCDSSVKRIESGRKGVTEMSSKIEAIKSSSQDGTPPEQSNDESSSILKPHSFTHPVSNNTLPFPCFLH